MPDHSYLLGFAKGFTITQFVEIPIVYFLLAYRFRPAGEPLGAGRIIAAAFFANMATLPYLWFVFPEFLDFCTTVALGEVTALVAEALAYHYLLRVSLMSAFLISLAANVCSVLVGLLIMPPFRG